MGIIQPSYDTNRQILGKILPLSTPFTVIVDSSERCNFRCNYCFRSDSDKTMWGYAASNKIMSRELFELIIDQLSDFPEPVKTISLSNHGEPLCNPDIPWMVSYIKNKGINSRISIHTNGSLLKGVMLDELARADIDRIVVSVQGLSGEKYLKTCNASVVWDELLENLTRFYHIKKNTQLYIKIVDVALDKGEEQVFYKTFLPIADRVYIEQTCEIWKTRNSDLKGISKSTHNKFGVNLKKQRVCPVIFHTIVVTPEGDVYPCTQLVGQKRLGNVKDKTLYSMWNSATRFDLLRKQLINDNETGACIGCGIKSNSFFTEEDLIDDYREEVLERLKCCEGYGKLF